MIKKNPLLMILNLQYGSIRPISITSCKNPYKILDNIVNYSKDFEDCFIINDLHDSNDIEFNNIPPHFIQKTQDTTFLDDYRNKIYSKNKWVFNKKTLSAINNSHIKPLVLEYDTIIVSGFSLELDIVPTCIDLISFGKKVILNIETIGSLIENTKIVDYLKFLGVNTL